MRHSFGVAGWHPARRRTAAVAGGPVRAGARCSGPCRSQHAHHRNRQRLHRRLGGFVRQHRRTGDTSPSFAAPTAIVTVWRKGKVAGIWVNAESVTFDNVPSFYAVVASRPLDKLIQPATAALYKIGPANLKLDPIESAEPIPADRLHGSAMR